MEDWLQSHINNLVAYERAGVLKGMFVTYHLHAKQN